MSEEERRKGERREEADIFNVNDPTGEPGYQPQPRHKTYTVKEGDTFESIAEKFYGDGEQWRRIVRANEGVAEEPDDIYPGLEIKIPEMRK